MTLYLLFERLERRQDEADTEMERFRTRPRSAPTNLDLLPRTNHPVKRYAGLVTRSGHDAAVVIGGSIGGEKTNSPR